MSFAERVDRFLFALQGLTAAPAAHYIDLETADDELAHALVTPRGGLVSIVEIEGARSMADREWLDRTIARLTNDLSTRLDTGGHTLQLVIDYDPSQAAAITSRALRGMYQASTEVGAHFRPLLDDWGRAVAQWCAAERIVLVLGTDISILTRTERQRSVKERRQAMRKAAPMGASAQALSSTIANLRDRHDSFLSGAQQALHGAGILTKTLDAHGAVRLIRSSFDPEMTGEQWRAVLPGDPLPLRVDDRLSDEIDEDVLLYPELPGQLMPRAAEVYDTRTIRIGDRLHMPMMLRLPPQNPEPFQRLFARLIQHPFPWRISLRIGGDGLSGFSMTRSLAAVLRKTSRENRLFENAIEELEAARMDGATITRFQAEFDTWVSASAPDATARLRARAARLASAIQAWGSADVSEVVGDPLLGVTAAVPATLTKSPSPAAAAPLNEVLEMTPITRPARLWPEGGLPLRSPDGRLLPFRPGSDRQAAWVDLYVAPMGSGKSVCANTMNFGFLLQPGLMELPYLLIIDIGPSSRGLIELVKGALPESQKHLADYRRLRMTEDDAINPCDTTLGCQRPMPVHRGFLRNFLSLLATPLNEKAPPDGVLGLTEACIERAYDDLSANRHPRPYNRGADALVDETVDKMGLAIDEATSYWDLVREFFHANAINAAVHAQRLAVPLIGDIAACARHPEIASNFENIQVGGREALPQFFWRSCTEAIQLYPMLAGPTRFDIGDARVVSIDLDEVAKHGTAAAERQSAVTYMLARHAGASRFFLQPEDLQHVPEEFRAWHRPRFENLRVVPKRIFYDEWHRVSRSEAVASQIASDLNMVVRESRKWNIHVALSSQDIGDFADFILAQATSVYILGVGNPADARTIANRLELPDGAVGAMNMLRAPNRAGAEMLAVFRTKDHGSVVQRLVNTLGPHMRIALDSSAGTATVRRRLSERIGADAARALLATHYPDGVEAEMSRRAYTHAQSGEEQRERNITDELIEELVAQASQRPRPAG